MIPFSPFRLDGVFYFRFFPFNLRLAILSVTIKAIEIRRKRSIKLADALIAATALDGNYSLITRNVDDFKNLKINIYNPFKS